MVFLLEFFENRRAIRRVFRDREKTLWIIQKTTTCTPVIDSGGKKSSKQCKSSSLKSNIGLSGMHQYPQKTKYSQHYEFTRPVLFKTLQVIAWVFVSQQPVELYLEYLKFELLIFFITKHICSNMSIRQRISLSEKTGFLFALTSAIFNIDLTSPKYCKLRLYTFMQLTLQMWE